MTKLSAAFRFALGWSAVLTACAASAQNVAPTDPLTPAEEQQKFHLPPGFEIQLFAAEPEIHKPINLTFDQRGRLFVSDTIEYPYPAKEGTRPRDTVKVLVDRDHDGRADDVSTLVDGLNIPLGVQPIDKGVIVYAIPKIFRCLDTDGDGRADQRDELYGTFGFRDTHGMTNSFTRGLDGWLYACHGFANDSTVTGADGQSIQMSSGNTYRMRLDGSHVEYFTHGQVNPFGLNFDALGNLYSADCHTLPIYLLLRGAYYPSFGKAHDGLDFGPTIIGHSHGSSGIGGIAVYEAGQFPEAYHGTVFVGNPVTGRVNHDRFEPHGSSYRAIEQPDFITCDDPWFRPVNLQVGPDGAMYIADFYNRIIGHYEVPLEHPGRDRERGRIWRVVYTGKGAPQPDPTASAPIAPPDLAAASLEQLLAFLADKNLTIRTLATHELVDRWGTASVEPVRKLVTSAQSTAWQRAHGLWVLARLNALDAALAQRLAADSDRAVRTHLVKALAEQPKWEPSLGDLVRARLQDDDGFVRRAAADALGLHPQATNLKPLLDLWASTPADDSHLVHTVRMALRSHLLVDDMYGQLNTAVGNDAATGQRLANVSLAVPNAAAAEYLWAGLPGRPADPAALRHVLVHIAAAHLPAVFSYASGLKNLSLDDQLSIVRALGRAAQERGVKPPDGFVQWGGRVARELLVSPHENQVRAGIDLARDLSAPDAFDELEKIGRGSTKFAGLRTAALDACTAIDRTKATGPLQAALAGGAEAIDLRQFAARTLGRIDLEPARQALLTQLSSAPERLAVEIAMGLAESPAGAQALVDAVAAGKASAWLLQESAVRDRLRGRLPPDAEAQIVKLTAGLPPQDQRVRELLDRRRQLVQGGQGDVARGAAIFQKTCANCHRIGDQGAKVGPNLDGIGVRGVDRLLEDTLDPNRNVDQAFRTTRIVTIDGKILSGLALREEGKVLVLADLQGKEQRLPLDEIEQRSLSPLSVMPTNIADLVPEPEFAELIAYLLSQREAAPAGK